MSGDFNSFESASQRFTTTNYLPTLDGWLGAARDAGRLFFRDIPDQGESEQPEAFLKRLQEYIHGLHGLDAAVAVVALGVRFGDHMLDWFRGGRWEDSGSVTAGVTEVCVRWDHESNGTRVFPVRRVAKFLSDPTDDLVSVYLALKQIDSVSATLEDAEPGRWVEVPGGLRARRENHD